jgi:regulatory protein
MRMIPAAVDKIIDHLLRNNFLNETRFAQAFARGKFRTKKWGRNRIVNELKMRQISKFNIKIALKEIPDSDYYKTFDILSEKRLRQLASEKNLQKKRKKLADYLFYRGWEPELVYDKINNILKY